MNGILLAQIFHVKHDSMMGYPMMIGRYVKNVLKAVFFGKQRLKNVPASSPQDSAVDVKELLAQYTVEGLGEAAEQYYQHIEDWNYHFALPFSSPSTTPDTLMAVAHLFHGLELSPSLKVLDFASGSCWMSRFINQMGCEVISTDVSKTALRIGNELRQRQPVFGEQPPHTFLPFDGRHINLPDASIDRIICLNAFHHIPNQEEVLSEMFRILRNGGIAGFSEPGPFHSQSSQAQYEMRNYRVLEQDTHIEEIEQVSRKIGFNDVRLSLYAYPPMLCSPDEFHAFLYRRGFVSSLDPSLEYVKCTIAYMLNRQTFFLYKGQCAPKTSRNPEGLRGTMQIRLKNETFQADEIIAGDAVIVNTSKSNWLPMSAGVGGVTLCANLFDSDGGLKKFVYYRTLLTPDNRVILPNETVTVSLQIPNPGKGRYFLEFDLVSEQVIWFNMNGSPTCRKSIEIY